jgi:hypothetical protein
MNSYATTNTPDSVNNNNMPSPFSFRQSSGNTNNTAWRSNQGPSQPFGFPGSQQQQVSQQQVFPQQGVQQVYPQGQHTYQPQGVQQNYQPQGVQQAYPPQGIGTFGNPPGFQNVTPQGNVPQQYQMPPQMTTHPQAYNNAFGYNPTASPFAYKNAPMSPAQKRKEIIEKKKKMQQMKRERHTRAKQQAAPFQEVPFQAEALDQNFFVIPNTPEKK